MTAPVHVRTQLREAVVRALKGTRTVDDRVFTGRPYPLTGDELPGLVVIAEGEQSEISAIGAEPILGRAISIAVIGYDEGSDIEDRLDAIAVDVEEAIAADKTLNPGNPSERAVAVAMATTLVSTTPAVDGEGTKRVGEIRMVFLAQTRTPRSQPGIVA